MCARAVELLCALVLTSATISIAYTVDCNHEYTDCDTELSKLVSEDDELLAQKLGSDITTERISSTTVPPTRSTSISITTEEVSQKNQTVATTEGETLEVTEPSLKPKPRLLNLNVDELQNFANALHNRTHNKNHKKNSVDLSDVNLDIDDDEDPKPHPEHKTKDIPDKFYTNLQVPFNPMMSVDRGSDEIDMCKENEITYKVGEHMERGCEETCECLSGGIFDCSPRCKHPYIRRGRRLNDPLCFESPVDDCCSIIACATGNGDTKISKLEVCRYANDTYPVGSKWHIGCEQTCTCEPNSIVTCKPRCNRLPPSDKCINVQDPNDACCEVQVCDVSHDVHEEPENITSSTSSTTETIKDFPDYDDEMKPSRPLVLPEPIGSVKVLQNNSVQVNLIHPNNTEDAIHLMLSSNGGKTFKDVELKYSNLILNLEGGKDYILKTKETDTKFNFTITASDAGANEVPTDDSHNVTKIGCYQDGRFYAVGEEFHVGCAELCECTGEEQRECAALVCPSHVGLELMAKGCVRWAPSPPAQPPNCCPRSARCLSDGTCHYKGVPVPNWSEVPISLTGCEQRCFCENGELDCQTDVCSPLPALPPQNLRCPPNHRPAAVNISDEDCCKQWGCLPNAGYADESTQTYTVFGDTVNYVTPLPDLPTMIPVLATPPYVTPPISSHSFDFYRHLSPVKSVQKYSKHFGASLPKYDDDSPLKPHKNENITAFSFEDPNSPVKMLLPESAATESDEDCQYQTEKLKDKKTHKTVHHKSHSHPETHLNLKSRKKMQNLIHLPKVTQSMETIKVTTKNEHAPVRKISLSKLDNLSYFLPTPSRKLSEKVYPKYQPKIKSKPLIEPAKKTCNLFEPVINNKSANYLVPKVLHPSRLSDKTLSSSHVSLTETHPKVVPLLKSKAKIKPTDRNMLRNRDSKTEHVLTKEPNPYETVLFRVPKVGSSSNAQNTKAFQVPGKPYSALDLENILSQMEAESIITKNLGRSADKSQEALAGQTLPSDIPPPPPHQPTSFLPTVPTEIHFPSDDIPDYDMNNIHRPLEPALQGLPPGLTLPPSFGDSNKKLTVLSLQSDSPTSVKMLFGLPPVLVGLRGSVDLRYTDKADEEISNWYSQVFAPADEILTTPRLEFRLSGLKPSTTYKVRGKLYLHNLPVEPESEVYTVRTQDSPVEEKLKEIDTRLTISDINDTAAHVTWRRFTDDELQFIDGIQVRYRPVGTPIYSMTELLHHSRLSADLLELRPGSRYEASLVLVPPPRATTELRDPAKVEFTTAPYVDPYNWTVVIEARTVGSEAAELEWRGVPSPAERWVRVYRAAHACTPSSHKTNSVREQDAFRLATRDLPATITLTGLEPNARCRVWLELFLSNGKIKTSNVLEINTKSLDSPEPIDNEIEASSISDSRHSGGDYYGALVGVGVVAALGALASLLLLLVVVRRHRPRSLPITSVPTAPRESSLPPYDNPAYKLELQQETMDL